MTSVQAMELLDLRRWAACGAVVVAAHAGLAVGVTRWHDRLEPAEPSAALVIELAPIVAAPAVQPSELPPGPEMAAADAARDVPTDNLDKPVDRVEQKVEAKLERKPEEVVEPKPAEATPARLPVVPDAEVAVAPPPAQQVVEETPLRQEPRPPAPITSAPSVASDVVAALPTAPTQGQMRVTDSKAIATWRTQIVSLIERNKRYPPAAQSRRQQGVAQVVFTLDRNGRVLDSRIAKSSGVPALDEEAAAVVRRAQPFPVMPRDLPGESVDLSLPLRFTLK